MKKFFLIALSVLFVFVSCNKNDQPGTQGGSSEGGPDTPEIQKMESPFKTVLGKTDEEISQKLSQMWDHYFVNSSNKVYYEKGDDEAYILDANNNDVRSVGMSWGMMICVQTDHKAEFDKLFSFVKKNMINGAGLVAFNATTNGVVSDSGPIPLGDIYYAASLLFAGNRWKDNSYIEAAKQHIKLAKSLFDTNKNIVGFSTSPVYMEFTDPSYSVPVFYDLFSRWSDNDSEFWKKAAKTARQYLCNSSNMNSGLFTELNNYDGSPHKFEYKQDADQFSDDAIRCAIHFGMDYYLSGEDKANQEAMAGRLIRFFEKDNYQHCYFAWDGSSASGFYRLGLQGSNAVACYCLLNNEDYAELVKKNLATAWNASLATGQYRYYDGFVHYMSMLHLCAAFKLWEP